MYVNQKQNKKINLHGKKRSVHSQGISAYFMLICFSRERALLIHQIKKEKNTQSSVMTEPVLVRLRNK